MCSNHESSDTATATGFASSITILDTVVTQMRLHPVKEARWFLCKKYFYDIFYN